MSSDGVEGSSVCVVCDSSGYDVSTGSSDDVSAVELLSSICDGGPAVVGPDVDSDEMCVSCDEGCGATVWT